MTTRAQSRAWHWLLVLVAAGLTLALAAGFSFLVLFGDSTCSGEPLDVARMHEGQETLVAQAGVIAVVWVGAAALARWRTAVLAGAVLCVGAASLVAFWGLVGGDWHAGFCF